MIHIDEKVDSAGEYSSIKNRPEQPIAGAISGTGDVTEQPLVLVINCGSSSLKFAVHALDRRRPLLSGLGDRLGLEGATDHLLQG
jgi:Acetokinase family